MSKKEAMLDVRYMRPEEMRKVIEKVTRGSESEIKDFGKLLGIDRRVVRAYLSGEHYVPWFLTVILRLLQTRRLKVKDLEYVTSRYRP